MTTVGQIYEAIHAVADFSLALDFDNVGLLVGDANASVTGIVVALDATISVVEEAVTRGANLILTHHPVIFHPLKSVLVGSVVHRLVLENISVISAHTNLDIAPGGVNDLLATQLELVEVTALAPENLLRVGYLPRGMTPPELAYYAKQKLNLPALRYCDGGRPIRKIAVCGGSGGGELSAAVRAGCEAYLTGDVKHDQLLEASRLGVTLLDGGHYGTECQITARLLELAQAVDSTLAVTIARACVDPATII